MSSKLAHAAHHTLADWDFEKGSQYRSLASDQYISAPTSLKFTIASAWSCVILCRIPATLNLPQGEVRSWGRSNAWTAGWYTFRNQAALGSADYQNCYRVAFTRDLATLDRIVAGTPFTIGTVPYVGASNLWHHIRLFWYNGKTPGDVPALCVDIYREVTGEWVKQGSTLYDTMNKWKDSSINRCGIYASGGSGWLLWFDDTEIWGPV